jgi:hypothetical protein
MITIKLSVLHAYQSLMLHCTHRLMLPYSERLVLGAAALELLLLYVATCGHRELMCSYLMPHFKHLP